MSAAITAMTAVPVIAFRAAAVASSGQGTSLGSSVSAAVDVAAAAAAVNSDRSSNQVHRGSWMLVCVC